MRQLTALDAQFLAMENGRVHGHVSMLAICDPSTAPGGRLDAAALRELVGARIHLLPPFRWRLVRVPFDLDHPFWIEDPDFDLDYHIRDVALPPPGDDRALGDMAAYAASLELDRSRPLWEIQVVHGLPGGKVALIAKVHHAAVDGLSGAEVLTVLLDLGPEGRAVPPAPDRVGEPAPSELLLLGRSLARMPLHPLRGLRALPAVLPGLQSVPPLRTLPGVGAVARVSGRLATLAGRMTGNEDGGVLEIPSVRAPRTRFNGEVSRHRRFAFGSLPLKVVKQIKNDHGVTVNDVVMAVCAGALRRRLLATGELPDEPLVAMVPLSVRTPEQFGTFGNRISMMIVPIATDVADPAERLATLHRTMSSAKVHHQALPATLLQDVTQFVPPALFARTTRTLFRVAAQNPLAPSVNLVISNVPGPPFPLYCGGARVEADYPVSVLFEGVGLNITVLSYQDHLDFGLIGDREMVPDTWDLLADLRASLDELAELAPPAKLRAVRRRRS